MFFQATALAAFAAGASAHMILSSPAPFAFEDSGNRQAPLAPKDWPCKQPGGTYAVTTMNTVAAGGSLDVQLMGGATHGGGSCQFSITTDTKPTKESQWKVLHSQIHGCQGGPADNNMSNNAEDMGNPKIPVKIPEGLPAGQYTFAWSWLNKHGNREFYMNCAPLEVTGGSDGSVEDVLGGLPDMFVANIPSATTTAEENPEGLPICTVAEGQDFMYPNPGESVTTAEGATPGNSFDGPGCAAQNAYGAGAGKLGSPSAGSGGETPSTPETAAPETEAPAEAPADPAPVAPAPVAPAPVAPAPAAPAPAAPASGNCTPCDAAGSLVCIGSDSFGICDNGCAVPQKLAAGTSCSNGAIARRSLKFPRGTLHNRHAGLHKRSSAL